MTQHDDKSEEHRINTSDRRETRGRRVTDQDGVADDALEDVSVPDQRRRKSVRRSGEDRRHTS